MAFKIDYNYATNELIKSMNRVKREPVETCWLSPTIDATFNGKKCLTYQYILITELLARSIDDRVDVLTLKMERETRDTYSPRMLCKYSVYAFQEKQLCNCLDGANDDPFVNQPGRHKRLSKSNPGNGDRRVALEMLCDNLPMADSKDKARVALDCVMTRLVRMAEKKERDRSLVADGVRHSSSAELRSFLDELLDQGFGGNALVLATSALYRIQYPESDGYDVVPHPVNQPGNSSRQLSDLDLMFHGKPFLGTELKDKPYDEADVRHAADTAVAGGLKDVLFVSGRSGSYTSQTNAYFSRVRQDYAKKGVYVGVCDIDSMMDMILSSHHDVDVPTILMSVYDQVVNVGGTPETQLWVYDRLSGK